MTAVPGDRTRALRPAADATPGVLVIDAGRVIEEARATVAIVSRSPIVFGSPAELRAQTGAYGGLHQAWLGSLA